MSPERIRCIVEGALMAAGRPLSLQELEGLFPEEERPGRSVLGQVLETLERDCEGRGYELRRVGSG
ncbi:MAG: SMC-Scp complex subunit ScpB, partial [Ectothiorhodospira sp.]